MKLWQRFKQWNERRMYRRVIEPMGRMLAEGMCQGIERKFVAFHQGYGVMLAMSRHRVRARQLRVLALPAPREGVER